MTPERFPLVSADRPRGLPRLLDGVDEEAGPMPFGEHLHRHGPLPRLSARELIDEVERSGLRGRGGAGFPTAVKLRAASVRRRASALIVNGSESEPASAKDRLLLSCVPHLVLDGAVLAAGAIGAREILMKLPEPAGRVLEALEGALVTRDDPVRTSLFNGVAGYVAGEETAVVNFLQRGDPRPTLVPPRPAERGYRNRPTLIQNPETLASLALIARYGAGWFRELGSEGDPGSSLVTVSGAVALPGVYEIALETPLVDLLDAADPRGQIRAVLVGGYFGRWVDASAVPRLRLSRAGLAEVDCSLGAGVIIVLGADACGLHESARLIRHLADESAGQCGPCVHGLDAIAGAVERLADGSSHAGELDRLQRWAREVRGRGACSHPDGVTRLAESTLEVFMPEIESHRRSACAAPPAGLPLSTARTPTPA